MTFGETDPSEISGGGPAPSAAPGKSGDLRPARTRPHPQPLRPHGRRRRMARLRDRLPQGPRRVLGVPALLRSADLPHREKSRLARRQGAYSVVSATGLIVRRGHELDRVLRALDKSAEPGGGVAGHPARRVRNDALMRSVVAPGPSARCISTLSSQRPNLKPTFSNVPTMRKPAARCSSIDGVCAESPITAIIWRKPRRSHSAIRRSSSARPTPRRCALRGDVDRILDA